VLRPEFMIRVVSMCNDKAALVRLMNELDDEKRKIRSFMSQFSNQPRDEGGLAGAKRMKRLRAMKDRLSFLIEEREFVRQSLGKLKGDQRALNKAVNSKSEDFIKAFYAATERILSEDMFLLVEKRAMEMLIK